MNSVTCDNSGKFGGWLGSELKKPLGQSSFIGYFFVLILLVGGLGIWISVFRDRTLISVIGSLLTFFPAIATSACFELVHSDERQPKPKFARNVAIYCGAILGVAVLVIATNNDTWIACATGIGASFLALLLWWLANANNIKLRDEDPIVATGGDPSGKPAGDQGDYGL